MDSNTDAEEPAAGERTQPEVGQSAEVWAAHDPGTAPLSIEVQPILLLELPASLSAAHATAITRHVDELRSAWQSEKLWMVIGQSKELMECVSRVALDALALSWPSKEDMPSGVRACQRALARPGDVVAERLAKQMAAVAVGITEIRNSHGSGHGRPFLPSVLAEEARLVTDSALGWCRWVLARLERALGDELSILIERLSSGTFSSGELRSLLSQLDIESLPKQSQRRLGTAVARRSRGETFTVYYGGVEPALSRGAFPHDYCLGLAEGLAFNESGDFHPCPVQFGHWPQSGRSLTECLIILVAALGQDGMQLLEQISQAPVSHWVARSEYDVEGLIRCATTTHPQVAAATWEQILRRLPSPSN